MKISFVYLSILLGLILSEKSLILGQSTNFTQIWQGVLDNNPDLKSLEKEKIAAEQQAQAASNMIYPQIYLSAQSTATDNPAQKFMGILNQRKVEQNDFIPQKLTNYDWEIVNQFALGVRLPIYEGGQSKARQVAYQSTSEAKEWQKLATKNFLYYESAQSYGLFLLLRQQKNEVIDLESRINELISRYHLGEKSNPVGYSGLLGLKNLILQLQGLRTQIDSETKVHTDF